MSSDLMPDWSDIPEDDEAEPLDAEPAHLNDDADEQRGD
jgi:hypothetical protein